MSKYTVPSVQEIQEAVPILRLKYSKLSALDTYYIDFVVRDNDYKILSKYIERFGLYWELWNRWIGGYDDNAAPGLDLCHKSDIAVCRVAYLLANHFYKDFIHRSMLPDVLDRFKDRDWSLSLRQLPYTSKVIWLITIVDSKRELWIADNSSKFTDSGIPSSWILFKKGSEDQIKLNDLIADNYNDLGLILPMNEEHFISELRH